MSAATEVKRREVEQLLRDAQAIIDQHKSGLPAEKKSQLNAMRQTIEAKRAEIEAEEQEAELKTAFTQADDWLNKPQRRTPHGVNGDDDDRKSLERAGWEFKGGIAYGPSSSGDKVPMFGENVLLGDISTEDNALAQFQKTTRAAMSAEYKQAYIRYARMMATMPDPSIAYSKLSPSEQKALSEGTDSSGGFLVPPDTQAEMLARTAQQAVMRRLCRVQTTNSDMLRWPMVAPNGTNGSIYSSGFVGSWAGETPAFSETDPGFQMFSVPIKKLRVATKVSNDLIADASFNVLAFLATDGARNMALTEDYGLLLGDGTALQPMGLMNGGYTTHDIEGTTSNHISNTVSDAGSVPKIISGIYLIPDQYVDGSVFLTSRTNEGKIAGLVGADGRPIWPMYMGSGFAAPPKNIHGLPVYNSSWIASGGTNANKVAFIGNLMESYIIAQRAQITTTVLRERFADTDQTGIIVWERIGGASWNLDAGRILIV